jgi:hypothetical protein
MVRQGMIERKDLGTFKYADDPAAAVAPFARRNPRVFT